MTLDGDDVRDLMLRDLRKAVAVVFEDTFLFTDTVTANIAFAEPGASFERVRRAATLAGADAFISELPVGYDTLLGERGFSMSGGQRQRIALARAILADPRVLILDDATSSVDANKEHEIRDALTQVMDDRTTIVIAHRPATIALAQRVVLLDDGRIVASGTHDELSATNARYQEVLAQAAALEAARAELARRGPERGAALMRGGGMGGGPGWSQGAVAGRGPRRHRRGRPDRQAHLADDAALPPEPDRHDVGPGRLHRDDRFGAPHRRPTPSTTACPFTTSTGGSFCGRRSCTWSWRSPWACFERAQIVMVNRIGESFLRDLRKRVFAHLLSLSMSFFDNEQTGRLVSRMTSDIDALENLVQQGIVIFVTSGLLFVGVLVIMAIMSPLLFLATMVVLPPVIVSSRKFRRNSNDAYLVVRDRIGQTLSTLQESLAGIRVVQAFGREDEQFSRFVDHNQAQYEANVHAVRLSARYFPVVEFTNAAATAVIIGVRRTARPLASHLDRHRDRLRPVPGLPDRPHPAVQPAVQPGAAVRRGPEEDLRSARHRGGRRREARRRRPPGRRRAGRRRRELRLPPGRARHGAERRQHHRVRRPSGSPWSGRRGRGSRRWPRSWPASTTPLEGTVSYGGVDLRDATFASVRHRIAVVPQEGFLFHGTILDNVRLADPDASEEDVRRALRTIGCEERFDALPDGLLTEVRERGSRLSAGERQLVSLARAALANPDVLILDEATSNLDPGTESVVERALSALMTGRTVIVIAHRLSTAERADRVGVVDAGGLLELGPHADLLAQGGRYAALYAAWIGGTGDPVSSTARG